MNESEYSEILSQYDVIVQKPVIHPTSYYEVYNEAHNIHDLLLVGEAIKTIHPDYYPYFENALKQNSVYSGNLFVTCADKFRQYTDWLFSIFDVVEPQIDTSQYDEYHKRVFGFLSEQLLSVWISKNHLSV